MTKAELVEYAEKELGLKLNMRMTKAEMIEGIKEG